MPGNLRRKLTHRGPTERDYLRARRQVLHESQICAGCHEAIDLSLKPVCIHVDTSAFSVETAHEIPTTCGTDCRHQRKANPWSGSADHIVPVDQLAPGDPRLVSKRNLRPMHKVCNQRKGSGVGFDRAPAVSSGDWF